MCPYFLKKGKNPGFPFWSQINDKKPAGEIHTWNGSLSQFVIAQSKKPFACPSSSLCVTAGVGSKFYCSEITTCYLFLKCHIGFQIYTPGSGESKGPQANWTINTEKKTSSWNSFARRFSDRNSLNISSFITRIGGLWPWRLRGQKGLGLPGIWVSIPVLPH